MNKKEINASRTHSPFGKHAERAKYRGIPMSRYLILNVGASLISAGNDHLGCLWVRRQMAYVKCRRFLRSIHDASYIILYLTALISRL